MSTNLEELQPHYDFKLRDLAKRTALINLLKKEYESLKKIKPDDKADERNDKAADKNATTKEKHDAVINNPILDNQLSMLAQISLRIISEKKDLALLEKNIDEINSKYLAIQPPYKEYLNDVNTNIKLLVKLRKKYDDSLIDKKLIKGAKEWIVSEWEVDADSLYGEDMFFPVVTAQGKVCRGVTDCSRSNEFVVPKAYESVEFYYDHGKDKKWIMRNRYVLYWEFDKNAPDKISDTNYSALSVMKPTGFGQTDNDGTFCRAALGQGSRKIKVLRQGYGEDKITQIESTCKVGHSPEVESINTLSPYNSNTSLKLLLDGREEYHAYSLLHNSNLDPEITYGFFLYPLDWGPFKTKPINELAAMKGPPLITYKGKIGKSGEKAFGTKYNKVKLHCTLPEWNTQLKNALSELVVCIEAYNLSVADHKRNLLLLQQMSTITELHIDHTYKVISDDEVKNKKKLKKAVDDMHDGIEKMVEAPSGLPNSHAFFWIKGLIEDKEEQAKKLLELLTSPLLLAELKRYIDHTKNEKISDDGEFPPGPYMEYEPHWNVIFETIAECYAAISTTKDTSKELWENDLKHGIDELASVTGISAEQINVIKGIWSTEANSPKRADEILGDQTEGLLNAAGNNLPPEKETLSTIIFKDAVEGSMLLIKQGVPTPGPPAVLQVILSCYDGALSEYMNFKFKSQLTKTTFHITLYSRILTVCGISIKNGNIDIQSYTSILSGLIIRSDTRNIYPKAQLAREAIKNFFTKMGTEVSANNKGKAYQGVYNSLFKKDYHAAMAKSVFTIFNMCLLYQSWQQASKSDAINNTRTKLAKFEMSLNAIQGTVVSGILVRRMYVGIMTGTTATKILETFTDRLGVFIGLLSGTLAMYDAYDCVKEGDTKKAMWHLAEGTGLLMMTTGYMLKKGIGKKIAMAGARLVAREAAIAMASGSTSAVPPVAGFLLVVGTVVSGLVFLKDMADITQHWFDYDETSFAIGPWQQLKSPPASLMSLYKKQISKDILEHYKAKPKSLESLTKLTRIKTHRLTHNAFYFLLTTNRNPYEFYINQTSQRGSEELTLKPAAIIDSLYYAEWYPDNHVDWETLSWRAVIPLHDIGCKIKQINDIVTLGDIDGNDKEISTIKNIIDFYKNVKKLHNTKNKENSVMAKAMVDLQSGEFIPNPTTHYYENSLLWKHPDFLLKANKKGLLASK